MNEQEMSRERLDEFELQCRYGIKFVGEFDEILQLIALARQGLELREAQPHIGNVVKLLQYSKTLENSLSAANEKLRQRDEEIAAMKGTE